MTSHGRIIHAKSEVDRANWRQIFSKEKNEITDIINREIKKKKKDGKFGMNVIRYIMPVKYPSLDKENSDELIKAIVSYICHLLKKMEYESHYSILDGRYNIFAIWYQEIMDRDQMERDLEAFKLEDNVLIQNYIEKSKI